MRSVVDLGVGLVLLVAGVAIGALGERSRARAGYLAKRYRDHLSLLFDLGQGASKASQSEQRRPPDVEDLRQRVLDSWPEIEADAWLFGDRKARQKLYEVHELLETSLPDDLESRVETLAEVLRGPFHRRLAPQKRWFR